MQKLLVIVGPTASGKSALAVKLARQFNGEVISADSRQVYKGLDIGTGKITNKEMGGIPHHLLDVASPRRVFTVTDFKRLAEKKIKEISCRGKLPIVCGGAGFYVQAVTDGLVLPNVPPNPKFRARLAKRSAAELAAMLKKMDPARFKTIDVKNPVRLIRAIEIVKALGKVPKMETGPTNTGAMIIGLNPGTEKLKKSVLTRVKKMINLGLIDETKRLLKTGVGKKRMYEFGFEYRDVLRYLDGGMQTKKELIDAIVSDTLKYAKHQMTWFKRDKRIHWVKN